MRAVYIRGVDVWMMPFAGRLVRDMALVPRGPVTMRVEGLDSGDPMLVFTNVGAEAAPTARTAGAGFAGGRPDVFDHEALD